MIAALRLPKKENQLQSRHARFLAMLPQIRRQAFMAFRGQTPEAREEAITEVIANAFVAFNRLADQGREDVAYPTPLVAYAVRQFHAGRHVGGKLNVRDVSSRHAQLNKGIVLKRLDRFVRETGVWREVLVEDKHAGPAETAAARIDVSAWYRSLPVRSRKIARFLAIGETTNAAAKRFNVSAGRVSQLRRELAESWEEFQSQAAAA